MIFSLFNQLRGRRADPLSLTFVRNAEEYRLTAAERNQFVIGEPQETKWYTKARLMSDGVVGLYKPQNHRPF